MDMRIKNVMANKFEHEQARIKRKPMNAKEWNTFRNELNEVSSLKTENKRNIFFFFIVLILSQSRAQEKISVLKDILFIHLAECAF